MSSMTSIGSRALALFGGIALIGTIASTQALAGPNNGKLSFTGGIDTTTAYFFRGILQERNGFIGQPYAEVAANLYENDDSFLRNVSLIGGTWASVHSEETGNTGTGAKALYELDFYGGLSAGLGDYVEVGAGYTVYLSPNNAFSAVQEWNASIGLDDSEWLGALALSPTALIAIETENTAFGPDQGIYSELAIEPAFQIFHDDDYPVTLSIPVSVGFSIDDYYENASGKDDDAWGFARAGLIFSVPLAFIPEDYGSWSASGGAEVVQLGTNLRRANDDDTTWAIGRWGIGVEY